MRLEGFEPPTNGLEGRRSSAELQAPARRVQPVLPGAGRAAQRGAIFRTAPFTGTQRAPSAKRIPPNADGAGSKLGERRSVASAFAPAL
jgi:hypothetical protein